MEPTHFHHGDILIHKEDQSRWRFVRYVIDKITVRASNAPSTGGSGSRTRLVAVPIVDSQEGKEQELRSDLFTKE